MPKKTNNPEKTTTKRTHDLESVFFSVRLERATEGGRNGVIRVRR